MEARAEGSFRDQPVSDAEREHVGELLQRAVGHGMLTLAQFTERMDAALAAQTRGELNSVLLDLRQLRLTNRGEAPEPTSPPLPPTPTDGPAALIRGRMGSVARTGAWHVPPHLHLNNRFANVTLDFTRAITSAPVITLAVDDYCTSLRLAVPPYATVDLAHLALVGSTITNAAHPGPPPGRLHFTLTGRTRLSTLSIIV